MIYRQFAGHEVEVEAHNPGHGLQAIANQSFLGGAIHLVDAVAYATGVFRWRSFLALNHALTGSRRRSATRNGFLRMLVPRLLVVV